MIRRAPDPAGDRARFERVYAETRTPILGFLLRRAESPEDAADLLADVYATAWRRITDVPDGDAARLWLFGVARNLLANHRRRARTRAGLATALANELASAPAEDDDGSVDAGLVREALSRLNDRDRELLTLNAWEDLTPAEIAAVLRRPAGVVRVQLHRARNRLRDELSADPALAVRASTSTGGVRS